MTKHIVFDCDGTLVDTNQLKYELFPGIKDLLLKLSAEDYTLYVWTARDRKSTLRILKEQGVLHLFDSLCTVEDALPKPHISGLLELVGNTSKSSVCVIGDTSNDILGAKNFGVKGIGAIWSRLANEEILKEVGADFITTDPSEISDWIAKNLS